MNIHPTLTKNAHSWTGTNPDLGSYFPVPELSGATFNRSFRADQDVVELAPGKFDWAIADVVQERNHKQGMKMLWCVATPPKFSGATSVGQYSRILQERYETCFVEVGNEFDSRGGDLLVAAQAQAVSWSSALDFADPKRLVLGSIQSLARSGHGLKSLRFALQELERLQHGFKIVPRAISVHVYTDGSPVEAVPQLLREVAGVVRSFYGPEAPPLWVTEAGHPGFSEWKEFPQLVYLRNLIRACRYGGAELMMHWASDDGSSFGFKTNTSLRRVWNRALRETEI